MTTEEKFEAESAEAEKSAEEIVLETQAAGEIVRAALSTVEAAPADPDELRITRAWVRARRALRLAVRAGAPQPSVRMWADGSAEFIFPGRLAMLLKGNAQDFTACAGNNRLSIASTVAEDADAVSIVVPGEVLGREKD